LWNLFSLIIGLAALIVGAELMIRGGASIGLRARLRPIVVGLTIIAFGTSCPELFICTVAAIKGGEAIAVSIGSIVGSNIFNILAILGFAALVRPISIQSKTMKYEMPLVLVISSIMFLLALDGVVGRADGVILFVFFILFLSYCYLTAQSDEYQDLPSPISMPKSILLVILGCAGLAWGGDTSVEAAVRLADDFNISKLAVGLIIVAFGTSLPELVTSIVAAVRRQSDLSVGNVIGSNVFNIGLVLSLAAMIRPLEVSSRCLHWDIPIMLLATLAVLPMMWTDRKLVRFEGSLLVIGIVIYVVVRISIGGSPHP
jgi:cation:H+ antiporter